MRRREALKSFLALPAAAILTRHKIEPGDVAVIELPHAITSEEKHVISKKWRELFPDAKLVLLEEGAKLKFVRVAD